MGPKTKSAIKFWVFFPAMWAGVFFGTRLGLSVAGGLGLGILLYWVFQTLVWPRVWQGEVVSPEQWRKNRIGSFIWVSILFGAFIFFGWLQDRQQDDQRGMPAIGDATQDALGSP